MLVPVKGNGRQDDANRTRHAYYRQVRLIHEHIGVDPALITASSATSVTTGSGATAVTLLPAMADDTAHITMLQRSPSYVYSLPATDKMAGLLRRLLPEWLNEPDFRTLVSGFQPAHPKHGGGGAFYVKIRRARP